MYIIEKVGKVYSFNEKKIHFVRQLIDLKMSTQRDLMTMSSDLNQSGKKMTSGKAIVYIDFFMWFFNKKKIREINYS